MPDEELGELPEGWEIRETATGRRYYVDHNNRTTQFTGTRENNLLVSRSLIIMLFLDPRLARKMAK